MTAPAPGWPGGLDGSRWDVVVVGAGPAGSAAAFLLAREGASVLVVERALFPRWKVCGSCLGPGTQEVLRLSGLGHVVADAGAPALHSLRLAGWGRVAELRLGASVALSRAALDAGLLRAAEGSGAVLAAPARARVGRCLPGARRVTVEGAEGSAEVEARVVVAADGLAGRALAEAWAVDAEEGRGRVPPSGVRIGPSAPIGFGALFPADASGYGAGVIHMAVGAKGYVGAVRLEDGTLDVAAALRPGPRPAQAVARILAGAGFPPLPEAPLAGWKGTPRLTRSVAPRGAERVLAVGDAAGYVEPFTGEGVGWALAGARALAPLALEGIRRWDGGLVDRWDAVHAGSIGAQARLCRALAWALKRPGVSRAGIGLLRAVPAAAGPFVRWAGRAVLHPSRSHR